MAISWYPKHMHQARLGIEVALRKTDLVVEILDARLPAASANPVIGELVGERPRLCLLNKSDLADPDATAAWRAHLERRAGTRALPLIATDNQQVKLLLARIRRMTREPVPGRPVRVLIVGIPNVGKSTLFNSLLRRKLARVGDEPAITKGQQVVEVARGVRIMDTPGLLWPRLDEEARALRLAASGAIRDVAVDEAQVAEFLVAELMRDYPALLEQRYGLADPAPGRDLLVALGRRRGCLVKGGEVDLVKAARVLLADLRSGRLGRVSLERPPLAESADPAPPGADPLP